MTFKHVFLGTAAASSLLLAVAALEPAAFSQAMKAQAATNVSVNINFYEDLAPYGNWVSYHDRYVWIPENVDDGWRPYTEGHWAYTRRYGWIWVSDERFGWATYHYGRWGYARDIGWYWVPGRRWAPAWVAWSYDGDDIAWAPLPPHHYEGYDGANIVISFGFIPDYYWQAVPVSAFLSADLSRHVYRDRDRVRRVLQRGVSRTVRILNKIVLNNAIKVDDIEKKTRKKVVVLETKAVDNPDTAGKADSNSVAIFNPEVKEEPNANPIKTRKVEEVVKEREAKAIPGEEQTSGHAATTTDEPVAKPKKDTTGADVLQKATASTDQPDIGKAVETPAKEQTVAVDTPRVAELKTDEPTKVIRAPAAPKPVLPPSKTLNLDTVDYDQRGNIVFGGRGPAGSKVHLYFDNNAAYGLAYINDKGTWTFAVLSPLTVGPHALRAVEIGGDGAEKSRIEMPFYREEPAKVATAPLTPATPEAPKPAEVATAQKVPAPTPPVHITKKRDPAAPDQQTLEKSAQAPADEQTVTSKSKDKEATASIDKPDLEKTVEVPAETPTVPVDEMKNATASTDQPTKVIQAPAAAKPALPPSRTVNLDTIDYDQLGNIVFGGRGPAGSKVQLYVDNNAYGLVFINDKGIWTFAGPSSLTVGLHTLRANEIGDDGAVKSRIEMPFYRDDPANVATAPQTPATPKTPKPAEVATAKEVPAPTPPAEMKKKEATASTGQPDMKKTVEAPAEKQTAPVELKKKEATASGQPDMKKTVEAPAEKQTAPVEMKKKEVTTSTGQPDMKKTVEVPADEPTATANEKKKATASIDLPAIKKTVKAPEPIVPVDEKNKATASIDQPAIKKTIEAPSDEPAVPVDEKKKATASINQPAIEKAVKAPAEAQTVPVDEKKKATASIDQQAMEKTVEVPADEPTAPVEMKKKKKVAALPEQQAVKKSVDVPAKKQAAPIITKKKKKTEKTVNTALKSQPKCDPAIADCPSALTPSKLKRQSTKRVIPNLPDVGAESWKTNCSAMFGGFSKSSEWYISSAGKRVSCAIRPKNARG